MMGNSIFRESIGKKSSEMNAELWEYTLDKNRSPMASWTWMGHVWSHGLGCFRMVLDGLMVSDGLIVSDGLMVSEGLIV